MKLKDREIKTPKSWRGFFPFFHEPGSFIISISFSTASMYSAECMCEFSIETENIFWLLLFLFSIRCLVVYTRPITNTLAQLLARAYRIVFMLFKLKDEMLTKNEFWILRKFSVRIRAFPSLCPFAFFFSFALPLNKSHFPPCIWFYFTMASAM